MSASPWNFQHTTNRLGYTSRSKNTSRCSCSEVARIVGSSGLIGSSPNIGLASFEENFISWTILRDLSLELELPKANCRMSLRILVFSFSGSPLEMVAIGMWLHFDSNRLREESPGYTLTSMPSE